MALTKSLDEVTSADAAVLGGKAYGCARLKQAGFPVPDGFVVLPAAEPSPQLTVELATRLAACPGLNGYAVRSSATEEDSERASFAGIYETWLNVATERVAEAIAACRASVASARAWDYRRARGMAGAPRPPAVLVQSMIAPVSSGVGFTLDPVSGEADTLVIASAWGVGEAVVGGYVEADQFRLAKDPAVPIAESLGDKRWRVVCSNGERRLQENQAAERHAPSLSAGQVRELAALLLRVERACGAPQDVEWCFDGRQFWILQSRPITTRPGARPQIEWTRANTREVLPDLPSPQVADFCDWVLNQAFRRYYGRLLAPEAELGPAARTFCGRVYFNLSQMRHICRASGTPEGIMLRALGHIEAIRPEEEVAQRRSFGQVLRAFPEALRLLFRQVTAARCFAREVRRLQEQCAAFSARDPASLDDRAILALFDSAYEHSVARIETVLRLGSVILYETPLRALCVRAGVPGERLLFSFLAAGEKSVSSQQAFDLLDLARFAREEETARAWFLKASDLRTYARDLAGTAWLPRFQHFLELYGHRGLFESEWSQPCFAEDPTPLLWALQAHVTGPAPETPAEICARQERAWEEAWATFQAGVGGGSQGMRARRARWLLRRIKRMYLWRERFRSELVRLGMSLRPYQRELAARLLARGCLREPRDYYFLTFAEIRAALLDPGLAGQMLRIVERRKAQRRLWERLEMPLLMRESELPGLLARAGQPLGGPAAGIFHGQCLSPGRAEGEVLVLHDPGDFARMKPGAILVAPATDPSWTPLFTLAAGLIVEVGGVLSHAATVAREYGLPAVANVKDATRLLRDGDRVCVDASDGLISRLEESARLRKTS